MEWAQNWLMRSSRRKRGLMSFAQRPCGAWVSVFSFCTTDEPKDLLDAIRAHASGGDKRFSPSEANKVIDLFSALKESEKQDILNFLRGL